MLADAIRRNSSLQTISIVPDLTASRDVARSRVAVLEALADARALNDVALSGFFGGGGASATDDEASTADMRQMVTRAAARLLLCSERSAPIESLAWTENLTWHEADFVRTLTHVARGNTRLRALDLSNNELDDGDVRAIADLLLRSTPLAQLTLARCHLSGAHMATLAAALAANTSLRLLSINGNFADRPYVLPEVPLPPEPTDVPATDHPLAQLVRASLHLKQLDISYCELTNASLPPVLDALANNASLTTVSMFAYEHFVSDATGAHFARVVRKNAALRQWYIVGHRISAAEQLRFARNLWANRRLLELWFESPTQPGYPWFASRWHPGLMAHVVSYLERNARVQPHLIWREIVDICLAVAPLGLPPYIVLEILDRLPDMWLVDHELKIRISINVHRFYRERKPAAVAVAAAAAAPAPTPTPVSVPLMLSAATARPRSQSSTAMRRLRDGKQRLSQLIFRPRTTSHESHESDTASTAAAPPAATTSTSSRF